MFSARIIDLVSNGDEKNYSLNHFRERLRSYRDEFFSETGEQLTNKHLRKYVSKMVGKGLTVKKDGELNVYSYDENTVAEHDLKRATQFKVDRDYPDDFDFEELEEEVGIMQEFDLEKWAKLAVNVEGGYLDREQYIKREVCNVCGRTVKEPRTEGGFG